MPSRRHARRQRPTARPSGRGARRPNTEVADRVDAAVGPAPARMRGTLSRFGALTSAISKSRGWSPKVSEGTVLGRWPQVVGEDISAHAEPISLKEGVLSISAESTAWATQLRMMQSQILAKIAAAVGDGVVKTLRSPVRVR